MFNVLKLDHIGIAVKDMEVAKNSILKCWV